MSAEENIKQQLISRFSFLDGKINITRQRRLFLDATEESFSQVFGYAVGQLGFSILCAITGLDEYQAFAVVYHLAQESGVMLNIKVHLSKERPVIKTITSTFSVADVYERELIDLFGIQVEGLQKGPRYPLPDDWPTGEHPLRKDWKLEVNKNA
ncbi:MAG: NADH-quinone oxidoreductase subunit C [Candidatus Omnitrophica bacterium]|nr:NADH-quinone oxidoreductase subunit C [Candidatus Omnitrophota bacterium]